MNIAIVGHQQAGKTTCDNFLSECMTTTYILKIAQPLYKILDIFGLPKDRAFMQEQSDLLKKHFGDDIFIKQFINNMEMLEYDFNLVCDDIRYQNEFDTVKSDEWVTIGIKADEKVRMERAFKNGLDFLPNHSSEEEIDSIILQCDYIVENNTNDLYAFKQNVYDIYSELRR
jgi:dephospho-CoA kinase